MGAQHKLNFVMGGVNYQISSLTPALDRAFMQLYEAFSGPKAFDLREFHGAVFEFLDKSENSPTSHDTYFNNFTILWTGYQNSGHFDHAEAVWEMALKPVLRWEHDHPGTFVHKGTPFYFWGMTAILRGEIDRGYLFMHRSVKEDERTNPRNYQKSPGFYFATLNYGEADQAFRPWLLEQARFLKKQNPLRASDGAVLP
jgi:hypothetical protein